MARLRNLLVRFVILAILRPINRAQLGYNVDGILLAEKLYLQAVPIILKVNNSLINVDYYRRWQSGHDSDTAQSHNQLTTLTTQLLFTIAGHFLVSWAFSKLQVLAMCLFTFPSLWKTHSSEKAIWFRKDSSDLMFCRHQVANSAQVS